MPPSFDEMRISGSEVREHYRSYERWLQQQPPETMRDRRDEAEMIVRRVGITFAVYGAKDEDGSGTERLIPFDLIPRVIPSHEWADMEKGLRQRVENGLHRQFSVAVGQLGKLSGQDFNEIRASHRPDFTFLIVVNDEKLRARTAGDSACALRFSTEGTYC